MKLRHLSVLLEVARGGSARSAAQVLSVTESAVSKTLKELEAELGIVLFERTKRGMRLTGVGRQFARHAAEAMAALQLGLDVASPGRSVQSQPVRIGAMPVVAAVLLPDALQRFMAGERSLQAEVISGSKATLLERLRKGEIEAVLGRLPPADDLTGLAFEQLFLDEYVFAVHPGHPLAAQSCVSLDDVARHVLVMPPRETVTWDEIRRLFVSRGATLPPRRVETISLQLSRRLACSSEAVWAISHTLIEGELAQGLLKRLPIDTAMLESPLGIVTRPSLEPSAAMRGLLQAIRATVVELDLSKPRAVET